jgi:hypothetical protein
VKLAGLLVVLGCAANAQAQPLPELEPKKDDQAADKKPDSEQPPKPRPRVVLKPRGGSGIGDDAPGGGPPSAESSKGGTPGGPSGSFTGPPSKP